MLGLGKASISGIGWPFQEAPKGSSPCTKALTIVPEKGSVRFTLCISGTGGPEGLSVERMDDHSVFGSVADHSPARLTWAGLLLTISVFSQVHISERYSCEGPRVAWEKGNFVLHTDYAALLEAARLLVQKSDADRAHRAAIGTSAEISARIKSAELLQKMLDNPIARALNEGKEVVHE